MRRIVILGSTGSIGRYTLDVVSQHPGKFELVGLAARQSGDELARQCAVHPAARLVLTTGTALETLLAARPELAARAVGSGEDALVELIRETKPDMVVNALVGSVGLRPTMEALLSGIAVAIANKETIVTGGEILLAAARDGGGRLIPIDSEHVAISQCLRGSVTEDIEAIYITASGGALRDRPLDQLADVGPSDALAHPTWNMGAKITIDSATLVNKGLEVIEAHWLFDIPYDKIKVVVHPQSIVHSL
ncbi:MAG: 1-deoxy-D-xylulose-5-phosphate reductoisomerase, partial [Candidatus Krumholzibacteria bacterium]|nr:1-deoxy-D-xylulose-5-phosphate reductoisomerase [Candidatus Krumholzibacteria bacterium]